MLFRFIAVTALRLSACSRTTEPDHSAPGQITYEVVTDEAYDSLIKSQVTQHLLIAGELSEHTIRSFLNTQYQHVMRRTGFKYHEYPTNVYIYCYDSEENARNQSGQWVAMLSKDKSDVEPETQIREEYLALRDEAPAIAYGLSEAQRREAYRALGLAEARAFIEAERRYPEDVKKRIALDGELLDQYSREVCDEYGLSEEQMLHITLEGMKKLWPDR